MFFKVAIAYDDELFMIAGHFLKNMDTFEQGLDSE